MTAGKINWSIRNFRNTDEVAVIALWNNCLTRDPINADIFHKRILLDVNFDQQSHFVAVADSEIVGYAYGMYRIYPYEGRGIEPNRGWVQIIFVAESYRRGGVGRALVEAIETQLQSLGKTEIGVANYSPFYFFPGPDRDVYPQAVAFFKALGYADLTDAVGMDLVLYDFAIPEEVLELERKLFAEGYSIKMFAGEYTLPIIQFMKNNFPGWVRNIRECLLKNNGERDCVICVDQDDEIVGFALRAIDDLPGHFGPFGVVEQLRSTGLGKVLFYKMLYHMYCEGTYHCWLAWTGGKAQKFYERAGMRVCKRHAIMKKSIER